MTLTARGAAVLIRDGARFGDVAPLLTDDARNELREWFVREPGVPRNPVKPAAPPPAAKPAPSREAGFTGDVCTNCGGSRMVRNGACLLCQDCATSSGCS